MTEKAKIYQIYPPGSGDVNLELGDHTLVLKPTLSAGLAISRQAGGIRGAIDKVMAMDLDTIVSVIRLGLGPKEAKRYPNLDELVYQSGLLGSQGEVLARLVEFLSNIARGGRPAEEEGSNKEDGDTPDPQK